MLRRRETRKTTVVARTEALTCMTQVRVALAHPASATDAHVHCLFSCVSAELSVRSWRKWRQTRRRARKAGPCHSAARFSHVCHDRATKSTFQELVESAVPAIVSHLHSSICRLNTLAE